MKKLIALALAVVMSLSLMACSSKCKEDGCDEKAYKNGYCEIHYAMHALGDLFG